MSNPTNPYREPEYDDFGEEIPESSSSFIASAVIGLATDSAIIGGILGGDILGGVTGDLLDGDLFD